MLEIRSVNASERAQWDVLFDAYAEFYNTEAAVAAHEQAWTWIHDDDEDFWCDLALIEGEIIGFTQYQLMHRSLSGEKVCYLSDLYVKPDIRGSGAGRAMIDHVFTFARERGISNVRWLTQDFNYAARHLYDSFGKKSDFVLYSFPVQSA